MELVGSPTDHATRRQSAQGASMLFLAVAGAWLLAWRKRRLWRARTTRKIIMTLGMERVHGGRIIVTLDGSAMDGKSGKIIMTLNSCFSQVEGNWKRKQPILLLQKEIWSNPWQFLVFVRNDEWWILYPSPDVLAPKTTAKTMDGGRQTPKSNAVSFVAVRKRNDPRPPKWILFRNCVFLVDLFGRRTFSIL